MKPTPEQIAELAADSGFTPADFNDGRDRLVERIVHLALERYGAGAGGGEPVANVHINHITGNPSVHFIPGHPYLQHGQTLYTHPSPTDLQSVRDRALDDAAAICRTYDCSPRMAAAEIEALKGKL